MSNAGILQNHDTKIYASLGIARYLVPTTDALQALKVDRYNGPAFVIFDCRPVLGSPPARTPQASDFLASPNLCFITDETPVMNFGNLSDLIGIATPQLLRKSWGTKAFHWMRKFRLIVIAVKSDHLSEPTFIDSDIFTWIAKNTPSLTPSPDSMEYIVMSWTLTGEPKSTVRK